ncbi:glycosyltransferase family 4 protein [Candidatus Frankia nodulisporulans]|uniref:glycosyltransferase family 4 protein n=1 Tax=Candidatus Frankia nodulisporulans TaxID=2060052 RepID=UPI0013CF548B|nr:glycosyltransferase family 4 protein [Candidatus Frankia nodulisporulans]
MTASRNGRVPNSTGGPNSTLNPNHAPDPNAALAPTPARLVLPSSGTAGSQVAPSLLTQQLGAPSIEAVVGRPPSLAELVETSGMRRVHVLAWRDLDNPESGGSELHADKVAERWAQAGIDVSLRTAMAPGRPESVQRNGYSVVRKAGRYSVFPRTALSGAMGRTGPWDGLVEIWNGMPFFSPVWARCPRVVFLHHVHAEMWRMVLSPKLARIGETVEFRVAPPMYRRTRILTLSQSSRHEIIDLLGLPPRNITVVPPGIDPAYTPAGERSPHPLVLSVGRLVPVKRFGVLIDALLRARQDHPTMEAVIVGEGYERPELEKKIAAAGAGQWLRLIGRVDDAELLALYRRAWVLTSASAREGWGMTITEAAACGVPSVATRIAGHTDAVIDGETGLLVEPADLGRTLAGVLTDRELHARLAAGALAHAATFTWAETARATFAALVREAACQRRADGSAAGRRR